MSRRRKFPPSPENFSYQSFHKGDLDGQEFADDGGHSSIINPRGQFLVGPDVHGETVLCAELDMEEVVAGKYMHDITGHYNRFDIFTLRVNRSSYYPLVETSGLELEELAGDTDDIEEFEIDREDV